MREFLFEKYQKAPLMGVGLWWTRRGNLRQSQNMSDTTNCLGKIETWRYAGCFIALLVVCLSGCLGMGIVWDGFSGGYKDGGWRSMGGVQVKIAGRVWARRILGLCCPISIQLLQAGCINQDLYAWLESLRTCHDGVTRQGPVETSRIIRQ